MTGRYDSDEQKPGRGKHGQECYVGGWGIGQTLLSQIKLNVNSLANKLEPKLPIYVCYFLPMKIVSYWLEVKMAGADIM